jgi:hypothetical protein
MICFGTAAVITTSTGDSRSSSSDVRTDLQRTAFSQLLAVDLSESFGVAIETVIVAAVQAQSQGGVAVR